MLKTEQAQIMSEREKEELRKIAVVLSLISAAISAYILLSS